MGAEPVGARRVEADGPPLARDVADSSSCLGSEGVARPGRPPRGPGARSQGRGRVRHHETAEVGQPGCRCGRSAAHRAQRRH
eukprot:3770409-Lingulodinium_polyedra.AAC.1